MSEEGGGVVAVGGGQGAAAHGGGSGSSHTGAGDQPSLRTEKEMMANVEEDYPLSPRFATPNPFSRKNTSIDLDDYFRGPRDISKHSKWPLFLQMHGSILPKLIVPLLTVGGWSTMITCLSMLLPNVNLGISNILLTVTGFVVGLGLSLRSSTAYERYSEGRRLWATLNQTCQSLGRVFWIHTTERPDFKKEDMLSKLTAMNLLVAFAVSLKHKLRFEPYSYYEDLSELIDHLETFAKSATDEDVFKPAEPGFFKSVGDHLGLPFAASNPRKTLKKATSPTGNLPLEILCYLSAWADETVGNGQLPVPMTQTLLYNGMASLNDVLCNTDRILTTPLPIAYTIAISQITWVYIFLLPFQLLPAMSWETIPAAIAAAYIILGILFIGREIENPFGNDVNDLPLDLYCHQVVQDLEIITARPKARVSDWVQSPRNKVLYPHSESSYSVWASRPEAALRHALRNRPHSMFEKTSKSAKGPRSKQGESNV